jgi:subtilase family serine protease
MTVGGSNPATDPAVTAVGGTNLETTFNKASLNSAYVRENADADTLVPFDPFDPFGTGGTATGGFWGSGSGPSAVFGEPAYQRATRGTARVSARRPTSPCTWVAAPAASPTGATPRTASTSRPSPVAWSA